MKRVFPLLAALALLLGALPALAAPGYEKVSKREADPAAVVRYGMTPIAASQVAEGTWPIAVKSSSGFFKVVEATLTVKDGAMTAECTLSSGSYGCVYPGAGDEAAEADEADYVFFDQQHRFNLPVPALNAPVPCAAWSRRKKRWYNRYLLFDASSLPAGALDFALPDYDRIERALAQLGDEPEAGSDAPAATPPPAPAEAAALELADGTYAIDVALSGGSGRAGVSSPTWLIVRDGRAYARLLWSSAYYDYMIVDDVTYRNETTDGTNSTFTIPIEAFDEELEVVADTTAMGDPVEIEYTLTFYSGTVGDRGTIPQEAARRVLITALIVIVAGGILNWLAKRRSAG